jgi:hypothetical protein
VRAGRASVVGENGNARTATTWCSTTRSPPPRQRGIAEPPRRQSRPNGPFSIPRAQALGISKGETFEWRLEHGELVLKRLGMLEK